MRSCHNCAHMNICKIYEKVNLSVMEGLREQALTTSEENTTKSKSSWMHVFRSLGSCCTKFEGSENTKKLNKNLVAYAKVCADSLKNNPKFVKAFINCHSDEARYRLVDKSLDENYDQIVEFLTKALGSEDEAEDLYEVFEHLVMEKMGV